MSEEESHALHLARCYEMVPLNFEISTFEANVVYIENTLGLWNISKPIRVQQAGKNVIILKLHKRTKNIKYGNFSSYGINSVSWLGANNNEKQFSNILVTL